MVLSDFTKHWYITWTGLCETWLECTASGCLSSYSREDLLVQALSASLAGSAQGSLILLSLEDTPEALSLEDTPEAGLAHSVSSIPHLKD